MAKKDQPPAKEQRHLIDAKTEWFLHVSADARSRRQHVVDLTSLTLRTLSVANGGALVALLTFIGHDQHSHVASRLVCSGVVFSAGLLFVVVGMSCAILWQGKGADHAYAGTYRTFMDLVATSAPSKATQAAKLTAELPSVEAEARKQSDRWLDRAILATLLSTFTFIGGALAAIAALV